MSRSCAIEGCGAPAPIGGSSGRVCYKHQARLKRHGDPDACYRPYQKQKGEQFGRKITPEGYVQVYLGDGRYAMEHRQIMAERLGRPLADDETVHHRNGVRSDNRPENLELWASRHPRGQRVADLIAWAKGVFVRYEISH